MSDHMQQARWCLYCDSATHFSHECRSTHGINTPQAVELHRLLAERDALKQTLHDELDENLRLRDIGGARPDEGMTTFLERVFAERDALAARVGALREAPSVEVSEAMGASGGSVSDAERLAFEAWVKGHCWALCAHWDGKQYISDTEQDGEVDHRAMMTRRMWAAWRDRAALASPSAPVEAAPEAPAEPVAQEPDGTLHDDGCFTWKRGKAPPERNRVGWRADFWLQPTAAAIAAARAEGYAAGRAAGMEEAAKVCENETQEYEQYTGQPHNLAYQCADAIREATACCDNPRGPGFDAAQAARKLQAALAEPSAPGACDVLTPADLRPLR